MPRARQTADDRGGDAVHGDPADLGAILGDALDEECDDARSASRAYSRGDGRRQPAPSAAHAASAAAIARQDLVACAVIAGSRHQARNVCASEARGRSRVRVHAASRAAAAPPPRTKGRWRARPSRSRQRERARPDETAAPAAHRDPLTLAAAAPARRPFRARWSSTSGMSILTGQTS